MSLPRPLPPPLPLADLGAAEAPLMDALLAAANRVIRSRRFVLGEEVAAFEAELAATVGVAHAVGVSSGTDALEALLRASGVGAGDEVVLPALSFFATAEAVVRTGAVPRFVDIAPGSPHCRPEDLLAAVGPRTRAVVGVHLFGGCADLEPLEAKLAAHGVRLLEDCAQGLGAARQGRRAGSFGDGAATSFFPAKVLGGWGDGGAVLTRDPKIARAVRSLRQHGRADVEPGADGALLPFERIGGNWRLDALQAAVLRVKLPWLERWQKARVELAARYHALIAQADLPLGLPATGSRGPGGGGAEGGEADEIHTWYRYVVHAPERDALRTHLRRAGIETAVYYPRPLPLEPALAHLGHRPGDFPHAEAHARTALALPLWVGMTAAQQERVVAALADFYRRRP